MIFFKKFKNKKVLITGHTGFKGTWLTIWLKILGAKVLGISNGILTNPSIFKITKAEKKIDSRKIDIRNLKKVKKVFLSFKPDFVFHLAAQSLVQKSYEYPLETFETNSLGTLNILEALKVIKKKCTVILITSDKSYKNLELERGYKENDIIGGLDPYSASKGSAELIIQSYINSYFKKNRKILIGVARAGNVIGGGDWSSNRLVPDCIKSWSKKQKVLLRNPSSTRPWQHVLEAVGGYLLFADKLSKNPKLHGEVFNFGPNSRNNFSVLNLVKIMKGHWRNVSWKIIKMNRLKLYESKLLKLNCSKAKKILKWKSILNFQETAKMTIRWYSKYYNRPNEILEYTKKQILYYESVMKKKL